MKKSIILIILFLIIKNSKANLITANPGNYTSFLSSLVPGDTLLLTAGSYTNNLTLNNINGTAGQLVVITGVGDQTIIQGQACCNTVSISKCSYIIISNFKLDGLNNFVDGVKAEGTTGNWAHHITIEKLLIENYYPDQQQDGISTKCPAWNWIIRKNKIIGSGTGMYLGNSNGDSPFVNGIIENNFISNSLGYNIEIKHQLNGVRDSFPGTEVNGYTIIRKNVFTKDSTSSSGANARPNLLVGGFPLTGWGSLDYYEIYGNFFFNNPVEALFQGTGNIMLYENIFVNHYDPSGMRAVYITPQNGVSPQDIKIFHNTVWAANSSGGIRLYNPDSAFQQYCYSNAVFSALPITNFSNSINNITDTYANAGNYVLSATIPLNTLNLYPQAGTLNGILSPDTLFQNLTEWNYDFNNNIYDWTYSGAYSGCCQNNGWQLQLDTIPTGATIINSIDAISTNNSSIRVYPNPASNYLYIKQDQKTLSAFKIYDTYGNEVMKSMISSGEEINISKLGERMYIIQFEPASELFQKTSGIYRQRLVIMK